MAMRRSIAVISRHVRRALVNARYDLIKPELPTTPALSTIWIVRHGEREDVVDPQWFDREQRAYDDPPLAELGRVQAKETGERLKNEQIDHIFSSPYSRTLETAQIISKCRKSPIKINVEPGICEVLDDECRSYPPGYRSTADSHQLFPLINTGYTPVLVPTKREENNDDVRNRLRITANRLLTAYPSGSILLVSHGGPIALLGDLLTGRMTYPAICGVSKATYHGDETVTENREYHLHIIDDTSHLKVTRH